MIRILPTVIARQDIVFPSTFKNISISRPFSVEAVDLAVEKFSSQIIFVSQKEKSIDDPISSDFYEVGSLCKVKIVKKVVKENKTIVSLQVEGLHRVRILDVKKTESEKPLWLSEFVIIKSKNTLKTKSKQCLLTFLSNNNDFFVEIPGIKNTLIEWVKESINLESIVDRITDLSNVNFKTKYAILCEVDVYDRVQIITNVLELSEEQKQILEREIERKVNSKISKQHKEFFLREKLKVIKEELGESSNKDAELDKLKKQMKGKAFPRYVSDKIHDEMRRFELCSSYSSEGAVIRSYLEWLINLPWTHSSKDELDFQKISDSLDEYHSGLKKIKERILEYIAVRRKSSKEIGTIICFVGAPGVGKTSLAKSIAKALNKSFVKIALGGIYDEAEIRGHRRTYVASLPGKIISAIRQSKCNNPVFLLDEIDKIYGRTHGDPIGALLEILDPKQNSEFIDNYLELEFDLSKVFFIATANYEDYIPEPLLDRMEIIYLSSYTVEEKMEIAKKHLIPEVLKMCGLISKELSFTDEAIRLIIQKYTREAGVRNLRQNIYKISRKFVKKQLLKEIEKQEIDEKIVREYLEHEVYDFTRIDEDVIPGVVNGMAFTECGGDLLPIEVSYSSGKGNLSLTGNLKDIMKESASVALAFVRTNEKEFGLSPLKIDWTNIDINLHVPSGGVPKDGPSAGVTIVTALISAFSGIPVSPKISMTGEITLRGKVLPIGGLKEKVISAVRGGVDTIFYPAENTKNLHEIPDDVKKKITLIPVKRYSDIFKRIFVKKRADNKS